MHERTVVADDVKVGLIHRFADGARYARQHGSDHGAYLVGHIGRADIVTLWHDKRVAGVYRQD